MLSLGASQIHNNRFLSVAFCAGIALIPPAARAQTAGATVVQSAVPRATTWRARIELSATVDADLSASLAAQRSGRVVAVLFSSGETVPAGATLVQLDDAPERAQLALDQARLGQADRDAAREQKLMTIAGASQEALEQAKADQAEAAAQVALDRADLAQLQVVAPFAGTLGIRNLSPGDYVQEGAAITTITQMAPLRVLFAVPQTEAGGITVGESFSLRAPSQASAGPAVTGRITALSPMVDAATNARGAEGAVVGDSGGLLPGMFGIVTLDTGAPMPAFAVPTTALNDSVLGPYVFVLDPARGGYTLRAVYVTEFGAEGNDTLVARTGLTASERIVAIGGFKLQDGNSVTLETP
jgi:RND family efflux transporter MFP subunit